VIAGKSLAAGKVKAAHHIPLNPIASLNENNDPRSMVTGMMVKQRTPTPDA
jgi:hypothetical protein